MNIFGFSLFQKVFAAIMAFLMQLFSPFAVIIGTDKPAQIDYNDCPAKYAVLYDMNSNAELFKKEDNERCSPASLTKILTACVALKYISPDTVFTVGSEQSLVSSSLSLCLILRGHRLTLYGLITGMLLESGNDAAYTVAVNVARAVSQNASMSDIDAVTYFCTLMNDYAKSLGAKDSNFVNPGGAPNQNHYTTAHDLLLISIEALSYDVIREIASTASKHVVFESGQNITWTNTNKLLLSDSPYYYSYATGLKTGTTNDSGTCLIAVANKDGHELLAVILGCQTNAQRYNTAKEMFNRVYNKQ